MITKLKSWYLGLSSRWKATLRTMFQNAVGAVLLITFAMNRSGGSGGVYPPPAGEPVEPSEFA